MREGNTTVSGYYGLADIPYFVREGAILVCNPPMMNLKSAPDRLLVRVVPGQEGSFCLYEDAGDTQDYIDGQCAWTDFSQSRSPETLSLVIAPRRGQYEGMLAERAWQVEFLLEDEPREVTVNGVATADWTYDALMRCVVVSVPASSCGEQVVVRLQRSASGISQVDGAALVSQRYFDLMGREYSYPPKGSYIVRRTFANGQVVTQKFTR